MVTVPPSGARPIEGKLLFLLDRVKTIVYLRERKKRKSNISDRAWEKRYNNPAEFYSLVRVHGTLHRHAGNVTHQIIAPVDNHTAAEIPSHVYLITGIYK